jgi:hypothetical protein
MKMQTTSTKHTQGPWRYEAPDEVSIKDADGGRVAVCTNLRGALGMGGRRDPNEVLANARLIAAAPELLEALRKLRRGDLHQRARHLYDEAQTAIAKATGA